MKIVLEIRDGDVRFDEAQIKLLLRDALGEFAAARTPADAYVQRRYQGNASLCTPTKVAEVTKRVEAAFWLSRATITVELKAVFE